MSLTQYKQKRKFFGKEKTTEPKPVARRGTATTRQKIKNKKQIFVIHKHYASHLHWDLRLEMNDVLKSWAVPKEPPKTKGVKRLAVKVEDHPLEYAKFHGTIPEGHYGAGKVEIWDSGTYELIEKNSKKIEFTLHGKKLHGKYCLIKVNYDNRKNGWLFFKL